jgi:sugar-specific transcriptional regulator TrmB
VFRDEDLETLVHLGLTSLQAKIYLALLFLENATMKAISKTAGIARQDAYRVVPTLEKIGLAERVITTPVTYKATPLRDGVSLLIQRKKDELTGLQKRTAVFLDKLQKPVYPYPFHEDDLQFAIIYDRKRLIRKFAKGNKTAQKEIACAGTWPDMKKLMSLCDCETDHFSKAMKKGVRIRIVTEKRGDDKSVDEIIAAMCMNPLFGIRFVAAPIPIKIVLYDGVEVNTSISMSAETDMPSLWSNNPNFVKILVKQFDDMWNSGVTFNQEKAVAPASS